MSDRSLPAPATAPSRRVRLLLINLSVNLAVLALIVAPIVVIDRRRFSAAWSNAHWPDMAVIGAASPIVLIHLLAVMAALGLAVALLVGRKGSALHRVLGWTWSVSIAIGALSSFFIHKIGDGFSFFHAYSVIVLVLLPLGLLAARAHRARVHAGLMVYLVVNILLSGGVFATYPGFGERLLVRAIFQ